MSENTASVEDEMGQALRVAIAAASQMADKFARAREQLARDAAHRSDQERRALQVRFEGERGVAAARLALVERPEFWDRANSNEIARMHETAKQWKDFDPRASHAAETIAREVQERYGVDVNNPGANAQDVRTAIARVELDRDQTAGDSEAHSIQSGAGVQFAAAAEAVREADRLDNRAADARIDAPTNSPETAERPADQSRIDQAAGLELQAREYELQADLGGTATQQPDTLRELAADARSQAQLYRDENTADRPAEPAPQAAETSAASDHSHATAERSEGAVTYDSAARRETMAAELKSAGIPQETIDVRMRADIAQGRPAVEAVHAGAKVSVPTTNRGRGRAPHEQVHDQTR